jgi:hypothetical protein
MVKKPPAKELSIEEMKAALQQAGYDVKRRVTYVRHTFVVEEGVYRAFRELVEKQGVALQDAVTEAFLLWVERQR